MSGAFGGASLGPLSQESTASNDAYANLVRDERDDERDHLANERSNLALESANLALADARRNDEQKQALHNQQMFINDNYDAIANDVKAIDPEADDYDDRMASLPLGMLSNALMGNKMKALQGERENVLSNRSASASANNTRRNAEWNVFATKGGGQHLDSGELASARLQWTNDPNATAMSLREPHANDIALGEMGSQEREVADTLNKEYKARMGASETAYKAAESHLTRVRSKMDRIRGKIDSLNSSFKNDGQAANNRAEHFKLAVELNRLAGEGNMNKAGDKWEDQKDGPHSDGLKAAEARLEREKGIYETNRAAYNESSDLYMAGQFEKMQDSLAPVTRASQGRLKALRDQGVSGEDYNNAVNQEATTTRKHINSAYEMMPRSMKEYQGGNNLVGNAAPDMSMGARRHFAGNPTSPVYVTDKGYTFNPSSTIGTDSKRVHLRHATIQYHLKKQFGKDVNSALSGKGISPTPAFLSALTSVIAQGGLTDEVKSKLTDAQEIKMLNHMSVIYRKEDQKDFDLDGIVSRIELMQ